MKKNAKIIKFFLIAIKKKSVVLRNLNFNNKIMQFFFSKKKSIVSVHYSQMCR